MRAGFVYVLSNPGLPGIVKVGRTVQDTKKRAGQLWREYGTEYPFEVISKHAVTDCVAVESLSHKFLAKRRVPKSEMFQCNVPAAQAAIHKAARLVLARPWYLRIWHRLVLPRAGARPKTLARARGSYRKHNPWPLVLISVALLITTALAELKPTLPGWMPDAVLRTASTIENML